MEPSGFRTIIISKPAKLDYHFGYMNIRDSEGKHSIFLREIQLLIIESMQVSITSYLLNEISNRKIKIIFCDEKHNPAFELLSIYGTYNTSKKINAQIAWEENCKQKLWQIIIKEKIKKQAEVLEVVNKVKEAKKIYSLVEKVELGDCFNIEAQVARIYFSHIFEKGFNRTDESFVQNSVLNYGYSILLSMFNRYVVANGYLTELGIFHNNDQNQFNLCSDLMEVFRPIVDLYVVQNNIKDFNSEEKHKLVDHLLNEQIIISKQKQYLSQGIQIYLRECFDFLNKKKSDEKLEFYEII